jgi:hypothetical protein
LSDWIDARRKNPAFLPTEDQISDRIAGQLGFTPDEYSAFKQEHGYGLFAIEPRFKDVAIPHLLDRAQADPLGRVAVANLDQLGGISSAKSWLIKHRWQVHLNEIAALPEEVDRPYTEEEAEAVRRENADSGPDYWNYLIKRGHREFPRMQAVREIAEKRPLTADELDAAGIHVGPLMGAIDAFVSGATQSVGEAVSGAGRLATDWLSLMGKAVDPEGTLGLNSPVNAKLQQLFGAKNLGDFVVRIGRKLGPDALSRIGGEIQHDEEIYQRIHVKDTPVNAVSKELGAFVPDLALSYALPEVKIAHVLFWPALAYTKARGAGKSQAEAVEAAMEAAVMLKAGEPLGPLARELTDSRAVELVKKGTRAVLGGELGYVLGAVQPGATPSSALASAVQFGGTSAKGVERGELAVDERIAGEGLRGAAAMSSERAGSKTTDEARPTGQPGGEGILKGIRRIVFGGPYPAGAGRGNDMGSESLGYAGDEAKPTYEEVAAKGLSPPGRSEGMFELIRRYSRPETLLEKIRRHSLSGAAVTEQRGPVKPEPKQAGGLMASPEVEARQSGVRRGQVSEPGQARAGREPLAVSVPPVGETLRRAEGPDRSLELSLSAMRRQIVPKHRMADEGHHATEAAQKMLDSAYDAAITSGKYSGVDAFIGGTGSGKSVASEATPLSAERRANRIIVESHAENAEKLAGKIDKAREAGLPVDLHVVVRDPVESYRSVVGRYTRADANTPGSGKVVPVNYGAATQEAVIESVPKLIDLYADDPGVRWHFIDNTGIPEAARGISSEDGLRLLGSIDTTDLPSKFNDVLDNTKLTKRDLERFRDQSLPSEFGSELDQGNEDATVGRLAAGYGDKNVVFTKDRLARAQEAVRRKLSPDRLNAGIDPTVIPHLLTIAGYHLEAGAREFTDWSTRMVDDLGGWVIPLLPELYDRALENIYWRSRRPGLDRSDAEFFNQIIEDARSRSPETLRDPGVDTDAGAAGLGTTTSTYSEWPTHLTPFEVDELMSRPDMKITDTKGAGAARPDRHHLFSQTRRDWFFKRGVDIDKYTIEMSQGEHSAYHTMGWNQDVEDFIAAEATLGGRDYSPIDILRFGVRMRRKWRLRRRKIVPYED